jgi:transposase
MINKGRLRQALRQAAVAVGKVKDSALGHFYRRIAAKCGKGIAVTATARKLATIIYNMIVKRQTYQPQHLEAYNERLRTQKIKKLQKEIQRLGVKQYELAFA